MPTGTATVSFGAIPATGATVEITGQTSILATSLAEAWVMGDVTTDNNENAHLFAGVSFRLTCGVITPGVGFTVYITCIAGKCTGDFKIKWVWN